MITKSFRDKLIFIGKMSKGVGMVLKGILGRESSGVEVWRCEII